MTFGHIYTPLPFIYGGNRPFNQLNHFNVSVMTVPVAKSIKEYQDTSYSKICCISHLISRSEGVCLHSAGKMPPTNGGGILPPTISRSRRPSTKRPDISFATSNCHHIIFSVLIFRFSMFSFSGNCSPPTT